MPNAYKSCDFNPRSPHGERLYRYLMLAYIDHFNPRSPHGERRSRAGACAGQYTDFNPRSPHGERPATQPRWGASCDFNPRSPHGERRKRSFPLYKSMQISTHAPRTGSDLIRRRSWEPPGISTHAPRTGSDPPLREALTGRHDFNPRSPHGERRNETIPGGAV